MGLKITSEDQLEELRTLAAQAADLADSDDVDLDDADVDYIAGAMDMINKVMGYSDEVRDKLEKIIAEAYESED